MSPGYLLELISHLPADSALVAAHLGGAENVWTTNDHLTANVFDALQTLIHVTIAAHSGKKSKPPEPIWRPGSKPKAEQKKGMFAATAMSMLAAKKANKAKGS